ncbi:hypothetical protein PAXRUDRAFT_166591, partial [Paxillus rubicundulus Ve08.2h10]
NPNACLQLFSDSTQSDNEEGCHKEQACHTKNTYYVQLTKAIFGQDNNPKLCAYSKTPPSLFNTIILIQHHLAL